MRKVQLFGGVRQGCRDLDCSLGRLWFASLSKVSSSIPRPSAICMSLSTEMAESPRSTSET